VTGHLLAVYGEFKIGKSWFGQSGPPPTLLIETEEGGSAHAPTRQVPWEWQTYAPPQWDGTWDTAVARISSVTDLQRVLQWAGQFRVVVIDSITDLQNKHVRHLAPPPRQMEIRDWGTLLRDFLVLADGCRQLAHQPSGPTILWLCRSALGDDGRFRPSLMGRFRDDLMYEVDMTLYLSWSQGGVEQRVLQCHPARHCIAGGRPQDKLPPAVLDPNLIAIMQAIDQGGQ